MFLTIIYYLGCYKWCPGEARIPKSLISQLNRYPVHNVQCQTMQLSIVFYMHAITKTHIFYCFIIHRKKNGVHVC
jgi:hypothetical protein